jgi:hypothetical protein
MFVQYAILTWNTSAIAKGSFFWLFVTDLFVATLSFTILKKVEQASTKFQMICYALGGAIGAQLALLFSSRFIH